DHILAPDAGARTLAQEAFRTRQTEVARLLRQYADEMVSEDKDRRLLDDFRAAHAEWTAVAESVLSLADSEHPEDAAALLHGPHMAELGKRTSDAFRV